MQISEHPQCRAFLDAIKENPDDDALRLVLADWLEEQGDLLAEFIRLQIELEPLKRPCTDLMAELERHKRLARIPPGEGDPDDNWPLALQLHREEELLQKLKPTWLGKIKTLEDDWSTNFSCEFRRGLVETAQTGLTALIRHGGELRRTCPVLRRMVVFGILGRGDAMASCTSMAGLREVVLAGWLSPSDAICLAGSPQLGKVQSLTVWIGARESETICQALARLPGLRELRLVQLWGENLTGSTERLDQEADRLTDLLRGIRPDCQVALERPFARRFPLDGANIHYGLYAGHLPGNQDVLVNGGEEPFVMYFDSEGRFLREEQLDPRGPLTDLPPNYWDEWRSEEFIELLRRRVGFEPAPIFVREFFAERAEVGVRWRTVYADELSPPNTMDPAEDEDVGRHLYRYWTTNQFDVDYRNAFGADGVGQIHSS